MTSRSDHLLMALWVDEREGEARDQTLHGQGPVTTIERAALVAEMRAAGLAVERDGEVRLTEKGEAVARALLRRHRLAERLLCEVLELPEDEFERSACLFEHHLSERVADRICTLLGHPTTCPHGRPIPPGDCCRRRLRTVEPIIERLSDIPPGDEARVVFLTPALGPRLERLGALGVIPGSALRVQQKLPSFVVTVGETEVALDGDVAREIFVARVGGAAGGGGARRGRGGALRGFLSLLGCLAGAIGAVGPPVVRGAGIAAPAPAQAQVLMTEGEAVGRLLGPVDGTIRREVVPDAGQRERISERIGVAVQEDRFTFIEGLRGGVAVGWVYVGDEKGLYEPITFAVRIRPDGTVADVEVLVYRESRGGEVSRRRFLNQYRGKGPGSPLRLNHDVLNITGATVSSRAVTSGVKKAVVAFDVLRIADLSRAGSAPR